MGKQVLHAWVHHSSPVAPSVPQAAQSNLHVRWKCHSWAGGAWQLSHPSGTNAFRHLDSSRANFTSTCCSLGAASGWSWYNGSSLTCRTRMQWEQQAMELLALKFMQEGCIFGGWRVFRKFGALSILLNRGQFKMTLCYYLE